MNWKSSVLRCDMGDDDCPVCRFHAGDKSEKTLMEVVRILDSQLGESEAEERKLRGLIIRGAAQ